jgi:UDP-N-acetylmuramyl pentapeptide phosphotransferase/UDP-N-acetylglucosamine-1-phosphate transferase
VGTRPLAAAAVAHVVTRGSRALLDRVVGTAADVGHVTGARSAATRPSTTGSTAIGTSGAAAGATPSLASAQRWARTNHRGEPVSLLEGPATAVGLLAGSVVGGGSLRAAAAAALAIAGGTAFGILDDLTEDPVVRTKGLRGHLGALAHGRVTTGGLKVLGIGTSAQVVALIATPRPGAGAGAAATRRGWAADVLTSGALVAATANLVNLLDLRPGRALKAASLCAGPIALAGGRGAGLAAAVVGAGTGALRRDLAEGDMLGDGGANAVGALLGTAIVLDAPRPVRLAVLAGVVALTLASERISFTQVIASRPLLRELDEWGRRPADERTAARSVAVPDADG